MPLSSSSVDQRIPEALSTSRKRNLIVEGQHLPDTEAASLRTSLCTPSADSFLAMSGSLHNEVVAGHRQWKNSTHSTYASGQQPLEQQTLHRLSGDASLNALAAFMSHHPDAISVLDRR
jgi:hypothetical protein